MKNKESVTPIVVKSEVKYPVLPMIGLFALTVAAVSIWSSVLSSKVESLHSEIQAVQHTASAGKLNFRLTEKEWGKWYDDYNENYFNGKLPKATVRTEELPANIGAQTSWPSAKKPLIQMNPVAILGTKNAREILLHEMIHVKLTQPVRDATSPGEGNGVIWIMMGDGHGADFHQEVHRLIGMGAFDDLLS
jgi:hypothetical protein